MGGVVYGAAYDQNLGVRHIRVSNVGELDKLRGSKYLQSEIGSAYKDALDDLEQGLTVLFSGTPCQTAAMNKLANSRSYQGKLLTVEVLCHGVPSSKVWKTYLSEIATRENSKFTSANMRDKRNGWYRYWLRLSTADGKEYVENFREGTLGKSFASNVFLRESCYRCPFATKIRHADISLGDLWGAAREEELKKYDDHDKGTSVILINSEKGKQLLHNLTDCYYEKIPYECLLKSTYTLYRPSTRNYYRKRAYELLGKRPFDEIVYKACHPSIARRVLRRIQRYTADVNKRKDKNALNYNRIKGHIDVVSEFLRPYAVKDECCGCNACFTVCPSQAITMVADEEGFLYPTIDAIKCTRCNSCMKICPMISD